jgi:hypothetical protein
VIRALIDRTKYLNRQIPHPQNDIIIGALRDALEAFEVRAAERHRREFHRSINLEYEKPCATCGHLQCFGDHHED